MNYAASSFVIDLIKSDVKGAIMEIKIHKVDNIKLAEITSGSMLINSPEEGLNLLGNIYYQGFDKMIMHEKDITPDFFDLNFFF